MVDFERARQHMVNSQVRTSNVSDTRLLAQLGAVAREDFVSQARRPVAYVDDIQWFDGTQPRRFMAPPAVLAKLLQLAAILPSDDALVIGAGTGYTVAVVAGLAAAVTGVEADAGLASQGASTLSGYGNALLHHAAMNDLPSGSFDVIIVEGALTAAPEELLSALRDGGRLVAPILKSGVPVAHLFRREGADIVARQEFKAALPMLEPEREGTTFVF